MKILDIILSTFLISFLLLFTCGNMTINRCEYKVHNQKGAYLDTVCELEFVNEDEKCETRFKQIKNNFILKPTFKKCKGSL